jgi:hypothetical protein
MYQPLMIDGNDCGADSGMNDWQEKLKCLEETCPSAALPTTDTTWIHPGLNPGHCDWKPVTKHLSYSTVDLLIYWLLKKKREIYLPVAVYGNLVAAVVENSLFPAGLLQSYSA